MSIFTLKDVYVLAIDVGSCENIGWADNSVCNYPSKNSGGYGTLKNKLQEAGKKLSNGEPVALGFEAPLWVPFRNEFEGYNSNRLGIEKEMNRAWSAGPGSSATAQALGLMPCCLKILKESTMGKPVLATTIADNWCEAGGLFVWEAFVSGSGKKEPNNGCTQDERDAQSAVEAFLKKWPDFKSDIPDQLAFSLGAAALLATGWNIDLDELTRASVVIGSR